MARKLILFELNEVPRRVFDYYCEVRPRSPIAQFRRTALEYETFTEDRGHLSPWVTWPTLHRGIPDELHTISHLGQELQEINKAYPPIWDLLVDNGITVGIGGSLHTSPLPANLKNYLFYLPDTFACDAAAFPSELTAYQAFNLAMVARSPRNVDTSIDLGHAAQLLTNLHKLRITAKTARMVAGQLLTERLHPERKVRRRVLQGSLAFDIIMHQLECKRPAFATFFTNHVAGAMHRFWAASFPQDFDALEYDGEWIRMFQDEIAFAMSEVDRFLARLVAFVTNNPEYILLLATSMGQAANGGDAHQTELMLTNEDAFMTAMGVPKGNWKRRPAMIPDYSFEVADQFQSVFRKNIGQVHFGESKHSIQCEQRGDVLHLHLAIANLNAERDRAWFGERQVRFPEIGFGVMETDFKQGCTGYHIPEGMLFAFDPRNSLRSRIASQISTRDIAPSILRFFNVMPPSYMNKSALFG